jgi:hypothetical protein
MLGNSWSGEGESVGFWEQMRIEREAKGDIVFWAVAGDQKPVRFVASEIGKQAITLKIRSMIIRSASVIGGSARS